MFDSPPAIHHLTDWSTSTMVLFILLTALLLVVMAGSFVIADAFESELPFAAAVAVDVVALGFVYWLHGKILRHIPSDQLVIIICTVGLALGLIALAWAYYADGSGVIAIPFITLAIASLGNGIAEWLSRVASSIPISVGGLAALLLVGALFVVSYVTSKR